MNINTFISRLKKIGVNVELAANYPWVYLYSVNGTEVTSNFHADHGFTAFTLTLKGFRFSDRRTVFKKIRQILAYNEYMKLTEEIRDVSF